MNQILLGAVMALAIVVVDAAEIHNEARPGDLAAIPQLFQESGMDVNHADSNGNTALTLTVRDGHTENVKLLIERGANVNHADNNGNTALTLAALYGHKEIVQMLIERGAANVNHTNNYGDTALTFATGEGYTEIVQLLIERGANVNHANSDANTALICASIAGHTEIVNTLLPHLQINDVLAENSNRKTALDLAKNGEIRQLIEERINQRFNTTKSAAKVA